MKFNLKIWLIIFAHLFQHTCSQRLPDIKLCVLEEHLQDCKAMSNEVSRRLSQRIKCITGRDRLACMKLMKNGEVNVLNVSPEEAYIGAKHFDIVPILFERKKFTTHEYEVTAVVHSDFKIEDLSGLKGKRSCHGGFQDKPSWSWPMSLLTTEGVIPKTNSSEELGTISKFFSSSCIPGKWSSTMDHDMKLKKDFPNLCCEKNCSESSTLDDIPSEGLSLKCLHDNIGDIAFTTLEAAKSFFNTMKPEEQQKYRFLCMTGETSSLTLPCLWASQPNHLFVTSSKFDSTTIQNLRSSVLSIYSRIGTQNPPWIATALVSSSDVTDVVRPNNDDINKYLGEKFIKLIDPKDQDEKGIRFCISTQEADDKCNELSMYAKVYGIRPIISCFFANSHQSCIAAVENNQADFMTLGPDDIYLAYKYHNMIPIALEQYDDVNSSYKAVAVVRRDSGITSLSSLKRKKSCHGAIGSSAGWNVPIGLMIKQRLIKPKDCKFSAAVGEYFSSGSCTPGASDDKHNPYKDRHNALCSLCIGDENSEEKCSKSSSERFNGYSGAFRCLASKVGDVAFVKHSSVQSYSDENSHLNWTNGVQSSDYVIICKNGGTRNVDEYQNCNLAEIPGDMIMTSSQKTSAERAEILDAILKISEKFGPKSPYFRVFGPYNNTSDLLFKDNVTELVSTLNEDAMQLLGDYGHLLENIDAHKCEEESASSNLQPTTIVFLVLGLISVFVI